MPSKENVVHQFPVIRLGKEGYWITVIQSSLFEFTLRCTALGDTTSPDAYRRYYEISKIPKNYSSLPDARMAGAILFKKMMFEGFVYGGATPDKPTLTDETVVRSRRAPTPSFLELPLSARQVICPF
jgi:hypothetical protein